MREMNSRQDNIILNALQFINDVVENPDLASKGGCDKGFECRLDQTEMQRPEYSKLLKEHHGGLLSQINLDQKNYIKILSKMKKIYNID